eukprot:8759637-Lingulodinium_polyedra.AAC.1
MPAAYFTEMNRVWGVIDSKFNAEEIFGPRASRGILRLSARAAHHDLPYGMGLMAGLVACTNGASMSIFPGQRSPLMLAV